MARAPLVARLRHILEAARKIELQIASKSFDDYLTDWVMRDVVEPELERISEASRHIPDQLKAEYSKVRWRSVADLGNVLRHAYDQIAHERVWDIVTDDLAPLKAVIEAILIDREGERRE